MKRNPQRVVASGYERRRLRIIADRVLGNRILDVGFAQQPNPWLVKEAFHVTGLDLQRPTGTTGYDECVVGDAFEAPNLPQIQSYDTIILGELIEHVERPFTLVRTLRSLLNPEGIMILSTPNPAGWPMIFFEWLNLKKRFYAPEHTVCLTPRWMHRLLNASGCELREMIGVGIWPTTIPSPATLSYQVIYIAEPRR